MRVKLTDIGPVKVLEFASLPHETIRTPEMENEILVDLPIKYYFKISRYFWIFHKFVMSHA